MNQACYKVVQLDTFAAVQLVFLKHTVSTLVCLVIKDYKKENPLL